MKLHTLLLPVAGALIAGLFPAAPVRADGPARKPNVLFIVVDDLCCSLGCYGKAEVKSPNIDRLAAKGMRFDRAYCQWPICNPSRTSFLTSRRPDTTQVFDNVTSFRRTMPSVVTLPQHFRSNGYHCVSLGKIIHQGLDPAGKLVPYQDAKSWDDCRSFEWTAAGKRGEGRNVTGGAIKQLHWTSAEGTDLDQPDAQIAAAAVKVIEERRDKPFFLAVGFHRPHDPFIAPKKYFDMYPLEKIKLHQPPADRSNDLVNAISRKSPIYNLAERDAKELQRSYYACITFMDAQLGKVLETLDRLNLWEDTIVVLIGDHGYHMGEHNWWNKGTLFEMCVKPPLLVWAPGTKGPGRPTAGIVEFIDLYPTLTDLCGLKTPAGLEGTSFRPLLDDPTLPGKKAAFTQKGKGRTVRTDRWRYTEWDGGKGGVELYDQSKDPLDYYNLADRPELAPVRRELSKLLQPKK